ncbi:MAG TPA: hypothetical protein PK129_08485, partial [Cellvibrionaceae bacterium]|nr:hypothetical protein [Cellvibrionaceae bacterium]
PNPIYARYAEFTLAEVRDIGFSVYGGGSTIVYLLNGDTGQILKQGYDSLPTSSLRPGNYVLEITNTSANYFTLISNQVEFGSADCFAALTLGQSLASSWRPECISSIREYIDPYQDTSTTKSRARFFNFEVSEVNEFKFDVSSSTQLYMYLYEGDSNSGVPVTQGTNIPVQTLSPGKYTLEVATFTQAGVGTFNVAVSLLDPSGQCTSNLSLNQTYSQGFLSRCLKQSQGLNSDPYSDYSKGYGRYYNFEVDRTSDLTFLFNPSTGYDSAARAKAIRLFNRNEFNSTLASAVSSGFGSGLLQFNKRVTPGKYTVELLSGDLSSYSLQINQSASLNDCQQAISLGQGWQGFSVADCQPVVGLANADPYTPRAENYVANRYDFSLNYKQAVAVNVAGDLGYSPRALYKLAENGKPLLVNLAPYSQFSFGGDSLKISSELDQGDYFVELWIGKNSQPMQFNLRVDPVAVNPCDRYFRIPGSIEGSLSTACQSGHKYRVYNIDPYNVYNTGRYYAQAYTVEVPVNGRYNFSLESSFAPESYWRANPQGTFNFANKLVGKSFELDLSAGFYHFEVTSEAYDVLAPFSLTVNKINP